MLIPIEVQGRQKPGFIEGTCNSLSICYEWLWLENEQSLKCFCVPMRFPQCSHDIPMLFPQSFHGASHNHSPKMEWAWLVTAHYAGLCCRQCFPSHSSTGLTKGGLPSIMGSCLPVPWYMICSYINTQVPSSSIQETIDCYDFYMLLWTMATMIFQSYKLRSPTPTLVVFVM